MSLFATRRVVGDQEDAELRRTLIETAPRGTQPLAGYWTTDGELLSITTDGDTGLATRPGDGVLKVEPVTPEEYGPAGESPRSDGAEDLKLVLVRRQLPRLTTGEFRAIALQAIMCAYEYRDMRWLRSYWARETDQLFCLFETDSHDLVREHAERSRIPCDEIHDAREVLADEENGKE